MKTDHSDYIETLRRDSMVDALCADLMELHDAESLSLDNWDSAKKLIKYRTGMDIWPNEV